MYPQGQQPGQTLPAVAPGVPAAPPQAYQGQPPAAPQYQQQYQQPVTQPTPTTPTFLGWGPGGAPQAPAIPAAPIPQQPSAQPAAQPGGGFEPHVYEELSRESGVPIQILQEKIRTPRDIGLLLKSIVARINAPPPADPIQVNQPQVGTQAQPQVGADGLLPEPQNLDQFVVKDQGLYVAKMPQFQQIADIANYNANVRAQRAEQFTKDPVAATFGDPRAQKAIEEKINAEVERRHNERVEKEMEAEYSQKLDPKIYAVDAQGNKQVGFDGQPALTEYGQIFARNYQELRKGGMGYNRTLFDTAMKQTEYEYAQLQQSRNPQPQGQVGFTPTVTRTMDQLFGQRPGQTYMPGGGVNPSTPVPGAYSGPGDWINRVMQMPRDLPIEAYFKAVQGQYQ